MVGGGGGLLVHLLKMFEFLTQNFRTEAINFFFTLFGRSIITAFETAVTNYEERSPEWPQSPTYVLNSF